MSKGIIYKITVLNFYKYNPNIKKGHKSVLISTGFLSDPKVRTLTPAGKLLVLSCIFLAAESHQSQSNVSAESTSSHFEVSHDSLVFQSGVKSGSLQSQLDQLQSLQILTYEKNEVLINRIEKKLIEKKRIPKGEVIPEKPPAGVLHLRPPTASAPDGTRDAIAAYCESWKARYATNPPISKKLAGQMKTLIKDHGLQKTISYIQAFLEMNDQWFVTKRHDIATLMTNLNAVAQYCETGRSFTRKEVANMDRAMTTQNLLDAVDRKEI